MQKICKQCGENFKISEEDLKFHDKISPVFGGKKFQIPAPEMCFKCRQQARFAYRNERNLYRRKCSKCGAGMISMFPDDDGINVYCYKCWWGDNFDPLAYGHDFDFSRPFFEQFAKLFKKVPLPHMVIGNGENADYTNYSWQNKNCYLVSSSDYNEDCYYSTYLFRSKNCFDCLFVNDSELLYQSVDCKKCYSSAFLQNCQDLTDCYFCFDCRGCQDCLGCVGLRKKRFYIFNQKYLQADYEKKKAEFFSQNQNLNLLRRQFIAFKLKFPHKFAEVENCEECSGDHLMSCKNARQCFDMVEAQDCSYTALGIKSKDCYDCTGVPSSELCYQTVASPEDYNLGFCAVVWPKSTYLWYCAFARSSNNCFGCVSLLKNEYCILNKQYTKEEYEKLVPKIVEHMKKNGEWGEFFPVAISPFVYNETLAQDYYPLTKAEANAKNWAWKDEESVKKSATPDAVICEVTGRPFKIIPQELAFYRKMNLPIPRRSPDQRHKERMELRNPRELWSRKCAHCGKEILTSYAPNRPEKVYCGECYLKEVY